MTKNIIIIGGGIVGATTAFYLAQNKENNVLLFDEGTGRATSAAVGIISPWLSQRRNKDWYFLAKEGAAFYETLLNDLDVSNQTELYEKAGTLLYKKTPTLLDKLEKLAYKRLKQAPTIGKISRKSSNDVHRALPFFHPIDEALFITGGARVDGAKLIQAQKKSLANVIEEKVTTIAPTDSGWTLATDTQQFHCDELILACGAWLPELLTPLGYDVDIRPQKGQLIECQLEDRVKHAPVIMPVGEIDLMPLNDGRLLIGATHENDQGYDLTPDWNKLAHLKQEATELVPELAETKITHYRVGTRAYTSDFLPFFGEVDGLKNIWVASGLGSSGLTTGPIIGKTLADWISGIDTPFDSYRKTPNQYITKTND